MLSFFLKEVTVIRTSAFVGNRWWFGRSLPWYFSWSMPAVDQVWILPLFPGLDQYSQWCYSFS